MYVQAAVIVHSKENILNKIFWSKISFLKIKSFFKNFFVSYFYLLITKKTNYLFFFSLSAFG